MRNRFVTALGVLGLATGISVTAPSEASAAAWDCPSGTVCFYEGTSGQGTRCVYDAQTSDPNWMTGDIQCSLGGPFPRVRSMRITPLANVASIWMYKYPDYVTRVGCVTPYGGEAKVTFREAKAVTSHSAHRDPCQT